MFKDMLALCSSRARETFPNRVPNAITESLILHVRSLIEIILSSGHQKDDLKLADLLPNFNSPRIEELRTLYGKHSQENSPCWIINKKLFHPTSLRSDSFDYTTTVNLLSPVILGLLDEISVARRKSTM